VRFEQRLRDGIHSGAIVVAFRRWKRSQVVPGHRYRTGLDMVEVESVELVEPSSVDAAQAGEAGYASADEVIADQPGIVSTDLAEAMGWERQDFKVHVRRLKELGLTLSLDVGYRLSPRGESYLNHLRTR
jgi:hypothetical protein